jgi:hypothetical protein
LEYQNHKDIENHVDLSVVNIAISRDASAFKVIVIPVVTQSTAFGVTFNQADN